jgi:uncharacterized protein DUF4038/collagenase-like protein with putative collagen-binding domain
MASARLILAIAVAVLWLGGTAPPRGAQVQGTEINAHRTTANPLYPLKVSANNRYLVDQSGSPFLLVGDSPQAMIGNLSLSDIEFYVQNRARYGINALWVNLLCNDGTACNPDSTTFDGIAPFRIRGDISTPNPDYFARVDEVLRIAAAYKMVVLLNPIETIGWLRTLRQNGIVKARAYGEFLGNRYRQFPNIVWMYGNDFQTWQDTRDRLLLQTVARGIRSADRVHLHTIELNFLSSGSLDDPTWRNLIELDAAYSYYPTYAQLITEYNRRDPMPVFLVEANYEFEHNSGTDGGSQLNLRRQAYWTMLSGATGLLYGSGYTWRFPAGWKERLDSTGVSELMYMKRLFAGLHWYDLVPDQMHEIVVDGFGTFDAHGSIATNDYVTAARSAAGDLLVAYLPASRTVMVDMDQLTKPVRARWYDPAEGIFHGDQRAPLINRGVRAFTPPGPNSAGDGDWVLVLDTFPSANGAVQ